MAFRFSKKTFGPHQTFYRYGVVLVLVVVLGLAGWAAHVTQAEFEVPLVDTTDFVPTDFQSIWTYNRQSQLGPSTFSNYEGYAVGKPTHPEDGTTALYRF